jgi:NTE family protein
MAWDWMANLGRILRGANAFTNALTHGRAEAPPPLILKPRPKIGLAFGGGFARGMAHIGVLKVFEQEGIPIDYIAGTSIGAAIGAVYCSGVSAKELEEIACMLKFSEFARWTISKLGLFNNDRMTRLLHRVLKVRTFEELRIPLAVSATDFATGESVTFTSGDLIDPVRASCAYPAVFLPVSVNGRLMVDGLLAHPVPAEPLRQMGAERVAGVYFSSHWVSPTGPKHVLDVVGQCFSIAQERMCSLWKGYTDVVLEPDVSAFHYDDFSKSPELIRVGEECTRAALPQIREWFAGTELDFNARALPEAAPEPAETAPITIQPEVSPLAT